MFKRIAFILFIVSFLFSTVNAQKRAFTIEDIYQVKTSGSQVISNDGSKILFTVSASDFQKTSSSTDIYIMNSDGSGMKKLITGYNPIWDNEGKGFYYSSYKEGAEQVMYLPLTGGEPVQVTSYKLGVSSPKLSSNGKYFLFQAQVFPEYGENVEKQLKVSAAMENGPIQAHLADSLFLRHWTEYEDGKYTHIFVYNIENKSAKDVTPGYFHSPAFAPGGSANYVFSPDSKEIAFDSKRVPKPESSTNVDIWTVSTDGTGLKNITSANKGNDNNPKYSPDGRYIAYQCQTIPAYESDKVRLAIYDKTTGKNKILTESFDNWVTDFEWAPDSKSIYFNAPEKGYQPLFKIDIQTLKINKIFGNVTVAAFSISPKDNYIIYSYSFVNKPNELAKYDLKFSTNADLTSFNKELAAKIDIRPAEQIWVKGADGIPVHVFLVKPHNFDPSKKYPVVINVHGGPQMQWTDSFRADWQVYPGSGYIVVFPNPHGSTGYGQKYTAAISGDWDGKVYQDVMKVTDHLEKLPYVNKDKIGAMGWSYGGYFMNIVQAKTKRYKCLASMMSIYDLRQFAEDTEELWFTKWETKIKPGITSSYEKMSPHNYAKNFATPALIISGERDYRIPYIQSVRYFTVLKEKGIDARLIIFKNDGHWPSALRSMPLYYNSHLEWFHKYLGGDPAPWDSKNMVKNIYLDKE
jgi:dipeptidyl aminopeptidase/acylaminoacyl peptidase